MIRRSICGPLGFLFLLAFAGFLPSCGGIGDSYRVAVDPHFTVDEQARVLAALDSWESAVPVHFAVEVGACSGVHGGLICIHASNHAEIAAKQAVTDGVGVGLTVRQQTWGHAVDGGEVFIDLPTVATSYPDDFQRIVAHEVGHAMQLEHDAPGNLMAAIATEDAAAPTCADDAQWYAVRGERPPPCPPGPAPAR